MGLHLAKQKNRYEGILQPRTRAYSDDHLVRKGRSHLNPVHPLKLLRFRKRPKSLLSGSKERPSEVKDARRRSEGHRDAVFNGYDSNHQHQYHPNQTRSSRKVGPTPVTNSAKLDHAAKGSRTFDRGSRTYERGTSSLQSVVNNDLRMRTYTKLTSAASTCTLETELGGPTVNGCDVTSVDCTIDDDATGCDVSDILQRTVAFLAYEVEPYVMEEYLAWKNLPPETETEVRKLETGSVFGCVESVREFLAPIIRDPDSEEYRSFCDFLRERVHEHYLADFLEVLAALLKLRADDERADDGDDGDSACVCRLSGDLACHRGRRFDLELVYVDRETRKTKSFNAVTSLKRRRYRKSRAEADRATTRVRVGDSADRFVPMLSVRMYAQCLHEVRIRQLQRLMETYPCIRDLALVKTRLEDQAKVRLGRAIELNVGLYQLDLNLSTLGDDGAMFLANALRSNRDLRCLNLAGNELTATGCRLLVKGFVWSRTLTELNLGFNDVADLGCASLAEVLTGNRCHLRRLRLRNSNVTPGGARAIFASLAKNSRLRLLDLGSNDVTDEPLKALSDSLVRNRTLTDLCIDNGGITKSGCRTLARPLKINTTLRSLSLSMNAVGDAGVARLAEGIKHNRSLTEISLNMCEISNAGLWDLLDAIRYNPKMRTVKLCYNLIDVGRSSNTLRHDVMSFRNVTANKNKNNKNKNTLIPSGNVAARDVISGRGKERTGRRNDKGVVAVVASGLSSSLAGRKSFSLINCDAIFGRDSAFFENDDVDDDDASVDDVSGSELYAKLVEVLHANVPLRVILWGNRLDEYGHHLSITSSSQDSIDLY